MIVQPFTTAQLTAMTTAAPIVTNPALPAPGARGYRIWNLSAAFMGIWRAEASAADLQDMAFPFQYLQGSFDEPMQNQGQAMIGNLAITFQTLTHLAAASYFFGYQFTKQKLERVAINLLPQQ
jgi:hypothetical protein